MNSVEVSSKELIRIILQKYLIRFHCFVYGLEWGWFCLKLLRVMSTYRAIAQLSDHLQLQRELWSMGPLCLEDRSVVSVGSEL